LLLEDSKVEDMTIANDDILIVELPKENDWVFESERMKAKSTTDTSDSTVDTKNVEDLSSLDIKECLSSKSRRGLVGLSNLGNTCFMNSGL